jgi:hypothetical protein
MIGMSLNERPEVICEGKILFFKVFGVFELVELVEAETGSIIDGRLSVFSSVFLHWPSSLVAEFD